MEKCTHVDQKNLEPKFPAIREFILGQQQVFSRQGSIVAAWRSYRGNRLGPFYSLRYRIDGRQVAVYLGRSAALREQVRNLLRDIQQDRQIARLTRQARAELRKCKRTLEQDLASMGLSLRGFEVQGWRSVQRGDLTAAPQRTPKGGKPCSTT